MLLMQLFLVIALMYYFVIHVYNRYKLTGKLQSMAIRRLITSCHP
jgi:hypothetical protein